MVYVEQNCTNRLRVRFKDKVTGAPVDVSDCTFACDVRKSVNYPQVLFHPELDETHLADGYIFVTINPADTELMVLNSQYVMDLLVKTLGGDIYKAFATSNLVLRPTVTKF